MSIDDVLKSPKWIGATLGESGNTIKKKQFDFAQGIYAQIAIATFDEGKLEKVFLVFGDFSSERALSIYESLFKEYGREDDEDHSCYKGIAGVEVTIEKMGAGAVRSDSSGKNWIIAVGEKILSY